MNVPIMVAKVFASFDGSFLSRYIGLKRRIKLYSMYSMKIRITITGQLMTWYSFKVARIDSEGCSSTVAIEQ